MSVRSNEATEHLASVFSCSPDFYRGFFICSARILCMPLILFGQCNRKIRRIWGRDKCGVLFIAG